MAERIRSLILSPLILGHVMLRRTITATLVGNALSSSLLAARMMWASILVAIVLTLPSISSVEARNALGPSQIERGLKIVPHRGDASKRLDLSQVLAALNIHSVSIALIDKERLLWARAWGEASLQTLYRAASLSKLVAASQICVTGSGRSASTLS